VFCLKASELTNIDTFPTLNFCGSFVSFQYFL
jgi:hypothetical protein